MPISHNADAFASGHPYQSNGSEAGRSWLYGRRLVCLAFVLTDRLIITAMSNLDWIRRSRAALWHPCTQMKHLEALPPLPIARGVGPWLIDYTGRRYLDAISSWWVNLFGHAEPRINAALVDQLARIEHVILAGCTHAPVVELSERLAALTGLGHAFYGSDGAVSYTHLTLPTIYSV